MTPAKTIAQRSNEDNMDLVVLTTFGKSPTERLMKASVPYNVIFETTPPLLLIRPVDQWRCRRSDFKKILIPLDGSPLAEQALPFVKALAARYSSEVYLLSVPEEDGNIELKEVLEKYIENIKQQFTKIGIPTICEVAGSGPSRTILETALSEKADLIVLTSHGRGGVDRQKYVKLGSVVDKVITDTSCPVFFVSAVPNEEL